MKTSKLIRVFSLLLSLVMLVALTGCNMGTTTSEIWEEEIITISGNNNQTDDATSNQNTGNTDTTSTQTTQKGSFDLKGKSVIMTGWGTGFEPQQTESNYKEKVKRQAEIEKKLNKSK